MRIKSLTPEGMAAIQSSLLAFCRKYGDRRITHRALRWFRRLPHTRWKQGTLVAIATEEKRLVGVIAFGSYGLEESFIVVHPDHRTIRIHACAEFGHHAAVDTDPTGRDQALAGAP